LNPKHLDNKVTNEADIGIGTFWNQSFNGKNQVWQQQQQRRT
jgi:hypothetical protein